MEHVFQTTDGLFVGKKISADGCVDITLSGSELYRLDRGPIGARLIALQGVLWVTQAGDDADHLLLSGQSFTVTRPGVVLVQGMPEGRVRVVPRPAED